MDDVGIDEAQIAGARRILRSGQLEPLATGGDGGNHVGLMGMALIGMGAEMSDQAFKTAVARLAPEFGSSHPALTAFRLTPRLATMKSSGGLSISAGVGLERKCGSRACQS